VNGEPRRRRPPTPATWLLLAAIGAVFVVETLLGGSTSKRVLVILGANVPELVLQHGQWWRLLTSMFLHIGLLHLLLNGWVLYQLGSLFEVWFGAGRLLTVYFASGLVGSLVSVLTMPDQVALSAGASGAVFGLLGALIAFLGRRRQHLLPAARSLLWQLAGWAAFNVVFGFTVSGIDNAAHLGGCAVGLLLGWTTRPPWQRT
jgi:rhomboid protease GluP